MKRILMPGTTEYGHLYITVEITQKKNNPGPTLSIVGVEGPKSDGNAKGSCGQCIDALSNIINYSDGWTPKMVSELRSIWRQWHLNDMRPGCEHVQPPEDGTRISVVSYRPSDRFYFYEKSFKDAAVSGPRHPDEYAKYKEISDKVNKFCYWTSPPFKTREEYKALERELLDDSWIRIDKVESSYPGHVWFQQHDDALLLKPCPICGYKWGSGWRFEPLPNDVLKKLMSYPSASIPIPSVWA